MRCLVLSLLVFAACAPSSADRGGADSGSPLLGSDGAGGGGASSDATSDVEGRAWVMDMASGRVTAPSGLGELLVEEFFYGAAPLVGVTTARDGAVEALAGMAYARDGVQDPCVATQPLRGAYDAGAGHLVLTADRAALEISGLPLVLSEVALSLSLSSDRAQADAVALEAVLDLRADDGVIDLLGAHDAADACMLIEAFGLHCDTCADGAALCIDVALDGYRAVAAPAPIEAVDEGC
jgi:hypothetical protein